jgi:hypothetical protein
MKRKASEKLWVAIWTDEKGKDEIEYDTLSDRRSITWTNLIHNTVRVPSLNTERENDIRSCKRHGWRVVRVKLEEL